MEAGYYVCMNGLSPDQLERQQRLLKRFLEENVKLNLSALRTEDTCWNGNILDSLSFLEILSPGGSLPVPHTLIDVGTGGGFPLLPLAIALEKTRCTGVDSTKKKIDAIERIARDLDLRNVSLIPERAEVIGRDPRHREHYDVVLSRAVAQLSTLLEYTAPLARVGGHVILWKSLKIEEELAASEEARRTLKCRLTQTHVYDLGGDWGKRQLLVFTKEGLTPRMYPREVGVPGKLPIQ